MGGKESRVNAIIGAIESGNVYLPEKKPFTGDFVDECAAFPNGKHDDQVDCMSQALNRLIYFKSSMKIAKAVDLLEKYFPGSKEKKRNEYGRGATINVI
jgi:phage terminase large subunit-like protein